MVDDNFFEESWFLHVLDHFSLSSVRDRYVYLIDHTSPIYKKKQLTI